jgi:hypothetical protein
MTTPPWPAGQTPYVTPDQLSQWPTGVSWASIPAKTGQTPPTDPQRYAVQATLCMEGTSRADEIANQPLRASQITEEMSGPDSRVTVQWSSGNTRILTTRWPVTQVLSVQVSPSATWPRSWTSVPSGYFEPEYPVDGLYGASAPSANAGGQAILLAPGYVCWPQGWPGGQLYGRNRFRVAYTILSGFPHASLTAATDAGVSELPVDDCTGWLLTGTNGGTIGAAGIIYDALGGGQEAIAVTGASAATGPGTLTLAAATAYAHGANIVVSAMPRTLLWASALLTACAAQSRGATTTTSQTISGRSQQGMHPLEEHARRLINTFRRTV